MNILILGASGWVGLDLIDAIWEQYPTAKVSGTYYRNAPTGDGITWEQLDYRNAETIPSLLDKVNPTHIVNAMMSNREEIDRKYIAASTAISKWASAHDAHYTFFSTSMVFDGDLSHPHLETDLANANGPYGKTKQQCEKEISQSDVRHCIVRFASPHGAHKLGTDPTRTVKFLSNLQSGGTAKVPRGIIQNRLHMPELCSQIATLTLKSQEGAFHLGPKQGSEELDFLRSLAAAFGYDPENVIENGSAPQDIQTTPGKVLEIIPRASSITEEDTIAALTSDPRLAHFHNQTNG